ncbi:MAG: hypothetical protein [Microviridae sp.]|nr:MAG: hypothetical protein [Microviridae sp.]
MKNQSTERARFRSTIDFKLKPSDMEKPTGKSLTVPDDTYTVTELLERHAQGLKLLVEKNAIWLDDQDIEDDDLEKFNRMEPGERLQAAKAAGEVIEEDRKGKQKKIKEKEDKDKLEYARYLLEKKEKETKPPVGQEVKKDQPS